MNLGKTKASLSTPRKRLVELMQHLNFGRIESLLIRCGEPVFDPPPRIVREIKFGAETEPRPERSAGDFVLKHQVVEVFALLDRIGSGSIDFIEVKHGLPFRLLVPERPA